MVLYVNIPLDSSSQKIDYFHLVKHISVPIRNTYLIKKNYLLCIYFIQQQKFCLLTSTSCTFK